MRSSTPMGRGPLGAEHPVDDGVEPLPFVAPPGVPRRRDAPHRLQRSGGGLRATSLRAADSPRCRAEPASDPLSLGRYPSLELRQRFTSPEHQRTADQGIDIDVAVGEMIEVPVTIGDGPLVYFCKFHRTLRHGRGSATGQRLKCARHMTPRTRLLRPGGTFRPEATAKPGMRRRVLRVSCP